MIINKQNPMNVNNQFFRINNLFDQMYSICFILSLVYQYFEREINEHKKTGRLPSTFQLNDSKYYQTLSRIRSKSDRLSYLRSLIAIINTPPSFAVLQDTGGVHTGFFCPYRILRQSDHVEISAWNYLKARRLNENLLLNCSGILSDPLARLIIDMRTKFNLLNEPWWPILLGVSDDRHKEILDVLRTKYKLHGAHLYTWETREEIPNRKDLTLICANRGETIFELDPHVDYIVQIDGDERQCCLGNASEESQQIYKNIVKVESRTK